MSKLLPPSKNSSIVKSNKSSIIDAKKINASYALLKLSPKIKSFSIVNNKKVLNVENKIIKIDTILKNQLSSKKKENIDKRKLKEQDEFGNKEKELEKQDTKPKGLKINLPKLPGFGLFNWIKNFIFNTILGYFAIRLIDHLPKLLKLLPVIFKVGEFIIDTTGKLLNGLVTFIDWGYKGIDATRGLVKDKFGDEALKNLDKVGGALNTFFNLSVIAGLLSIKSGGFGRTPKGGSLPSRGIGGRPVVTTSGGGISGGLNIRNPFRQRPTVTTSGGDSVGGLGLRNPLRQRPTITGDGSSGIAPKFGIRGAFFIGPIIDIAIRTLVFGDPLSKAIVGAAGALAGQTLGTWIGGMIGGVLGSVVPFLGNAVLGGVGASVGLVLGGFIGDFLATSLYDFIVDNKSTNKLAEGGSPTVKDIKKNTRGTSSRRTLTKRKKPRSLSFTPQKIKPGKSAGGDEKIQKVFPNPKKPEGFLEWFGGLFKGTTDNQTKKQEAKKIKPEKTANSQEFLIKSNDVLGRSDFFGPFFTLAYKAVLGDRPNKLDYKIAGIGLNSWLQKTFNSTTIQFAGGGEVDASEFFRGEDYTNVIAKSVEESVSGNVDSTIRDLSKELALRPPVGREERIQDNIERGTGSDESDMSEGGITGGKWGPLLDLISSVESAGGSYDSRYGGIYPGYSKLTIAQADAVQRSNYKRWGSAASGKYQFMNIASQAAYAGLKPTDLFSPENQDRMAIALIEKKRSGRDWLSGKISDPVFAKYLSMEWAGLPRGNDNLSYYHGDGRNKAHTTFDKVLNALLKVKRGGYSTSDLPRTPNVRMGRGYGKGGQKIAGDLGDFMKANRSRIPVTGSIHRHPRHPPWSKSGHSAGSLHYQGRAIDLGGWSPSNPNSGGRDEQVPVIRAVLQWNKKHGYSPVELIHHSPKYKNLGRYRADHNDHVHVAYGKGGETPAEPHIAILGDENKKEYIIGGDAYEQIKKQLPGLLDVINYDVKDKPSLQKNVPAIIESLSQYAPYEQGYNNTVVIIDDEPDLEYDPNIGSSFIKLIRSGPSIDNSDYEILEML